MKWNELKSIEELNSLDELSFSRTIIILKHSTRCHISATVLKNLERQWQNGDEEKIKPYYLDLLKYRDVSDEIARRYNIVHQSPQLIIIRNGKSIYDASHHEVSYDELQKISEFKV